MSTPKLFYDDTRHPAAAAFIVRHRSCAEAFGHGLASLTSLVTCVFSGVAWYFAVGASDYPLGLCVLTGVLWLLVTFAGEYAVANSKANTTYAYLVTLYSLWVSIIWTASMCYTIIPSGVEYVEENWYLLQTKVVIPFTTQLDQKVQFTVRGWGGRGWGCW